MYAGFESEFVVDFDVSWDEAEFLFDFSDDFEVWGAVEGVSSSCEKFEEIVGDVSACDL